MIDIISVSIFLSVATLYIILTLLIYIYWNKISYFKNVSSENSFQFISLVVAVRNEAAHIIDLLNDINMQSYPRHLFEMVVVDDSSTDDTVKMLNEFKSNFSLQVISLNNNDGIGKKNALNHGIKNAVGHWIISTDGDCRVGPKWIETIMNFQSATNAKMIFGGVSFCNEKTIFEKMQTVEFAALTGSGAASLQAQMPNMCNGANIAYNLQTFHEVMGFEDNIHLASGDDEFLMHKIYQRYPSDVRFIKNVDAVVFTNAKKTISEFVNQRIRWSSKWKQYTLKYIKFLAIFIFLGNINWLLGIAVLIMDIKYIAVFTTCIVTKTSLDYFLIKSVLKSYRKPLSLLDFILSAICYPIYVVYFGLKSNSKTYQWKYRQWVIK